MANQIASKYPLLNELLELKDKHLQATYTVREIAQLFNVSTRTIQNRVASGQIRSRDLPGRAKFLCVDLENYLATTIKKKECRYVS